MAAAEDQADPGAALDQVIAAIVGTREGAVAAAPAARALGL